MPKKPIVLGIGEVLWDLLPGGKQPGGAPINFAYHAQQLGASVFAISAVGNDPLGDELIMHLRKVGIDTSMFARCNKPTGTVDVSIDATGTPAYTIHEGVAWDNIPLTEPLQSVASRANAICFGSLAQRNTVSRNTIENLISHTPKRCLQVFDVNLRQNFYTKAIIEESLAVCNILKLNDEEFSTLSSLFKLKGKDDERIELLMKRFSIDLVALTQGARGSLLVASNDYSYMRTPEVAVADTVGAGDAFTAALTMGFLNGLELKQMHERAINISAFVCTQHGAMPRIPSMLT